MMDSVLVVATLVVGTVVSVRLATTAIQHVKIVTATLLDPLNRSVTPTLASACVDLDSVDHGVISVTLVTTSTLTALVR